MKLKYKFNEELSKLTESDEQRKRRARVSRKAGVEIARNVIQFAEEMTDAGAQTDKLDHRKVEENMVSVLEDAFDQLALEGYDVAGMLDDGYVSESIASDLKRKFQGKVSGKQQIKRIALSALQHMVDGIKDMDNALDDPAEFRKYVVAQRKELVTAIKIIKAVED